MKWETDAMVKCASLVQLNNCIYSGRLSRHTDRMIAVKRGSSLVLTINLVRSR